MNNIPMNCEPANIPIHEIKEAILKKIRIVCGARFALPRDLKVEVYDDMIDFSVRDVCYKLEGYILGENPETKTIKHPEDWLQAIKERWFAKWMLKKWPVKYTIHTIDVDVLYPDLTNRLSFPEEQRTVIVRTSRNGMKI